MEQLDVQMGAAVPFQCAYCNAWIKVGMIYYVVPSSWWDEWEDELHRQNLHPYHFVVSSPLDHTSTS